jgi:hypothetical protein
MDMKVSLESIYLKHFEHVVYPLFMRSSINAKYSHFPLDNGWGTGSVQFQTHGMEKISAKDKPCSMMPKATAGTCLMVKWTRAKLWMIQ